MPLWTGTPDRGPSGRCSYFLAKLPEFPAGTFTSINLGFSPDCHPELARRRRPALRQQAAKICPVLTWDYSVSEGEGRSRPVAACGGCSSAAARRPALGCYSGGICYTMAPKLQCLSLFCCAEAWWDPARQPDAVLADFGRLVFGDELAAIGPLLEEFEVVPDWGYYPPFPYSPSSGWKRAWRGSCRSSSRSMPTAKPQLPLAPTMAEYRRDLLFFAELFRKLAGVAMTVEQ